MYASKNRRKLKKRNGKRIRRPHNLQFLRLTKDRDVTFGYEEEEMSENEYEQDMSIEEESFQFRVDSGASCQGVENMAGPPSAPPSSSSPSTSSSPSSFSSDSDSDDDDFWNRPYIRNCCRQLKNDDFIQNLIKKLYRTQCLQDFILLVTQLADGSLSPLNIAFLLCLEHAKNYGQVISKETTKGKYDPKKSEINFAVHFDTHLVSSKIQCKLLRITKI